MFFNGSRILCDPSVFFPVEAPKNGGNGMTALERELLSPFDPDQVRGDLSLSYKLLRKMGGFYPTRRRGIQGSLRLRCRKNPFRRRLDKRDGQIGKFLFQFVLHTVHNL